jgi:aryl-alcohol dehydrogenase-like predicted oxidoreductase
MNDLISQDETSEAFIGEWAEKRGIRDQLVIATKVLPGLFDYSYSGR